MLAMDGDDVHGGDRDRAQRFLPSAPPFSPTLREGLSAPWIDFTPPPPPPPPPDFHQYPGVAYGTFGPSPPPLAPFAPPGFPDASRAPTRMFVAQRAATPPGLARSRRQRHSYNLVWAFSAMARFVLLLVFDVANGLLGLLGAAVVWSAVLLSVATLPLCCFGVVLFHSLLRVACYLCQADVVAHNAVADAEHRISLRPRARFSRERESLLPLRRPAGRLDAWDRDRDARWGRESALRFEKTLYEPSPRAILAAIYFATVKPALGVLGLAAVGLVLADVGFLMGDARVRVDIPHMDEHPLAVYLAALALLLVALVLVHGLAEISKRVTRFFCCEVDPPGL